MSIDQDITNLPTPPSRNDSPSDFTDKADAFLGALPTFQSELNTYADEANALKTAVNTSESNAAESALDAQEAETAAENFADSAAGAANFVGAWATLTGALTVPSSVSHIGAVWVLTQDIADVTAEEPGASNVWIEVTRALAKKPEITSPADGAQDIAPNLTIEGSAFSPVYSADQRDYRQIQIIEAGGSFAAPLIDEQISTDDYNFAGDPDSDYQARIRDKIVDSAFSAWSDVVSFNTANVFVDQPTITSPADNATDIAERPVIESSAFTVVNGSDTHVASQWVITRVSDSVVVFDSGEDTTNLESIKVPAGVLDEGEVSYTAKVRHKGSTYGFSAYSQEVTFTTATEFFDYSDPANIGTTLNGGFLVGVIDTVAGTINSLDDYQTGERYALIISPKSLESGTLQWDSLDRAGEPGSFTRWDGLSSTENILAKNDTSYQAFEHIRSIRSSNPVPADDASDWYLPAMDEMEIIYRNLKPVSGDNSTYTDTRAFPGTYSSGFNPSSDPTGSPYTATGEPFQTGLTDFQDGGSEAVDLDTYWTSTDANEGDRAFIGYLGATDLYGRQDADGKSRSGSHSVRPVRRLPI